MQDEIEDLDKSEHFDVIGTKSIAETVKFLAVINDELQMRYRNMSHTFFNPYDHTIPRKTLWYFKKIWSHKHLSSLYRLDRGEFNELLQLKNQMDPTEENGHRSKKTLTTFLGQEDDILVIDDSPPPSGNFKSSLFSN